MTPLIKFIVNSELPEDKVQAQTIKRQALSPATLMKPIWASCPFDQWGMDIVGPFPVARAQKKFLLVAVDYFSKWKNIVCRFGAPRRLISDNGRQFQGKKITAWCQKMKITQSLISVASQWSNIVLPVKIGQSSALVESCPDDNYQSRAMELDLVEEKREHALIRMEAYRGRVMKSYNKRVRIRDFQVGDLVMKKVNLARDVGKLEARWEGPFKIT
ncbi:uncharacterized protein LOC142532281 [Primulina tabacum]|uniref:uncharacterized protein LOC142532281 n=1 Tax=Primulina tabacum TaxID=48773 RepID=UPI003F597776